MDPLINKSGRAVLAIALILFCCATIAWLVRFGAPANGLHQTALSWSYTVLCVTLAALGLNVTVDGVVQLITARRQA